MFPADTRILVVDDVSSLRDLLKAYLQRLGFFIVQEAEDGTDAFRKIVDAKSGGYPYELIISDWNMPNMTGIDLLKTLRSTPGFESVPFILLTTESEKAAVLEAVSSQVSNYIVKPIDQDLLKLKLQRTWERIQSGQ